MTDQSTDTKNKILEAARILFATHGYEGTSVREIAKNAEVNIASVNYHFSSKENLLSEILRKSHEDCSLDIQRFYEGGKQNAEDLLVEVFRYFIEKSHDLIAHFKMMMSVQHANKLPLDAKGQPGPPGGEFIVKAITKEVGREVSFEDLHWALKVLMSHTVHMSLMFNCCFKTNEVPFTSKEDIEKSIRRLTRVVLQDLKDK